VNPPDNVRGGGCGEASFDLLPAEEIVDVHRCAMPSSDEQPMTSRKMDAGAFHGRGKPLVLTGNIMRNSRGRP
jgi:hypothetical protein